MNYADVHAHLELLKDAAEAVKRAEESGVKAIITNGVDGATNRKALQLQEEFPIVKAALGIYPVTAAGMDDEGLAQELAFIRENSEKISAIGEIGLDYQETEDREKQQRAFQLQLQLCKKLDVPAIVHTRKAEKDAVETIVSSACSKVILHAFHGNMKLTKAAADAGLNFSIPSNIVRSSQFQNIAEIVPLEQLHAETDAPYLGPGKDGYSEPSYVPQTVQKIAEIKKLPEEEAAGQIYANYTRMFGR